MNKDHEVEFRALVDRSMFERLLAYGRSDCAKMFKGPLTLVDTYFCAKEIASFKEIEMDKVGSYSLRLRVESSNGTASASLNTKIIRSEGDHNAWLEHEVDISSSQGGEKILETIGFKKFFELRKERYSFMDGDVHVCLEDIADFQPAIEVEIMVEHGEIDAVKAQLLAYLDRHGISKDALIEKSITNMLMRRHAKF